ncbi:MAG: hypothetical protein CR993_09515 [Rhodobacterales bacterium]|nr:MAG: hypothetical protein CR993_09515 [Rhodobacterales bacterium]
MKSAAFGRGSGCDVLIKIVSLFLVFIAVLAIFGRLRFPLITKRKTHCAKCGRPLVGRGPCPCGDRNNEKG